MIDGANMGPTWGQQGATRGPHIGHKKPCYLGDSCFYRPIAATPWHWAPTAISHSYESYAKPEWPKLYFENLFHAESSVIYFVAQTTIFDL